MENQITKIIAGIKEKMEELGKLICPTCNWCEEKFEEGDVRTYNKDGAYHSTCWEEAQRDLVDSQGIDYGEERSEE